MCSAVLPVEMKIDTSDVTWLREDARTVPRYLVISQ